MCPASESRASEEARIPTTTSTAMKPTISAIAIRSRTRSVPAEGECAWAPGRCPWVWPAAIACRTKARPSAGSNSRPPPRRSACDDAAAMDGSFRASDVVKRAFEAFDERDLKALFDLSDPEIEISSVTGIVAGREKPYHGQDALGQYLQDVENI